MATGGGTVSGEVTIDVGDELKTADFSSTPAVVATSAVGFCVARTDVAKEGRDVAKTLDGFSVVTGMVA